MLFHIVSVSVKQNLKALTKFEIYENSKKIPKNAEKIGGKFSKWHGFLTNFLWKNMESACNNIRHYH